MRPYALVFLVAAFTMLTACASIKPVKFVGPNGRDAYSMRCSGFGRTLEACYKKSGEICPLGYEIIDRSTGMVIVPTSDGIIGAPKQTLTIECK